MLSPGFLATVKYQTWVKETHYKSYKFFKFRRYNSIIRKNNSNIYNKYFGIDVSKWQGTINFDVLTANKK